MASIEYPSYFRPLVTTRQMTPSGNRASVGRVERRIGRGSSESESSKQQFRPRPTQLLDEHRSSIGPNEPYRPPPALLALGFPADMVVRCAKLVADLRWIAAAGTSAL